MEIREDKHKIEMIGEDENGKFEITIVKKSHQLHISSEDLCSDAFVNLDIKELTILRDCINKVLDEKNT